MDGCHNITNSGRQTHFLWTQITEVILNTIYTKRVGNTLPFYSSYFVGDSAPEDCQDLFFLIHLAQSFN